VEGRLLGITEVAALVNLSRQRILQLIESDPAFPKPAAQLARGRLWRQDDIETWARATGRET
jgi:predicted DNA-binding transcriptional regulator AlpA